MSIYGTGDVHREIDYDKIKWAKKNLKEGDFLIVTGDFGWTWDTDSIKEIGKRLRKAPFTTLFCDGNHDNHFLLDNMPVHEYNGAKVHILSKNILHVLRGEIMTLPDAKILFFGGAESVDKFRRTVGVSWWDREYPNCAEMDNGLFNLEKHDNKVDLIITHDCPARIHRKVVNEKSHFPCNGLNNYFDNISDTTEFREWWFGHHHEDRRYEEKYWCLYNSIRRFS